MRELDRRAIVDHGISGIALMRRAAAACVQQILAIHSAGTDRVVTVCCGSGNNAADGYIVAGMLCEKGWDARVIEVGDPEKLSADGKTAYQYYRDAGVNRTDHLAGSGIVVDALLGTGLSGEVRPAYVSVIDAINASGRPVVSVDIPSGLSSDTGEVLGCAVKATVTVTFIGRKRGLYTADGPDHAGDVVFASLQVPEATFVNLPGPVTTIIAPVQSRPRKKNSHKNTFGHVLVVGGDHGMGGAVVMAAEAALRAGAGMVSVATRAEHVLPLMTRCPEAMTRGIQTSEELSPLLARASLVVVGPGLGTQQWGRSLLTRVLESGLPLVVDADGLNLLAQNPQQRDNWILTPHPGEARTLLGRTADRFTMVTELQAKYGGAVVLKGVGSLVASSEELSLCDGGNPGMAAAGMGDLLSGVAGALFAQHLLAPPEGVRENQHTIPFTAATQAVYVHATAGDHAAADGMAGLKATDLLPHIRKLVDAPGNPLGNPLANPLGNPDG